MRTIRFFIAGALLLALGGGMLSSANAADYWYGHYAGWYQYPFGNDVYRLGNVPTPPYFAIHPPVYYGKRVGMPYGNSPYTRPPRPVVRVSPQSKKQQPARGVMIENPFVKQKKKAKGSKKKKDLSSKPKIIVNPYVVSDEPKETEQLAAH
jgi:hypothetical protein